MTEVENIFFMVIKDLKYYLAHITLVGGWLPFLYARYLWNDSAVRAITTVDIDFSFGGKKTKEYSKTIFQALSSLNYKERHFQAPLLTPLHMTPRTFKDKEAEKIFERQYSHKKLDPLHPEKILQKEFLEPLGLSQNRLAIAIGVRARRINEIVLGKEAFPLKQP